MEGAYMGEVIAFRPKKPPAEFDLAEELGPAIDEFLQPLREDMTMEAYIEFLCGVADPDFYDNMDEDTQELVNQYWDIVFPDEGYDGDDD